MDLQNSRIPAPLVGCYNSSNGALILDDTYNAAPESTLAALNLLSELQAGKIAVLGDMLELGQYEKPDMNWSVSGQQKLLDRIDRCRPAWQDDC